MKTFVTPKQVAQAIKVSESSLKRWCDQGMLPVTRTAGGHRRLMISDVFEFLRRSGQRLDRPELLGLPSNTGCAAVISDRACETLRRALVLGDEDQCRRIVFDLYLSGHSACEICDRVLTPAFYALGNQWEVGELSIYRERRAVEIALKMLHELRLAVRTPAADACSALVSTLEWDPYRLPASMIELVLREQGWQATLLGTQLPADSTVEAIHDNRPKLICVSVSCIESVPLFLKDYARIQFAAGQIGSAVVVGGRALPRSIRLQMTYSAFCDTLRNLVAFASSLNSVEVDRSLG